MINISDIEINYACINILLYIVSIKYLTRNSVSSRILLMIKNIMDRTRIQVEAVIKCRYHILKYVQ